MNPTRAACFQKQRQFWNSTSILNFPQITENLSRWEYFLRTRYLTTSVGSSYWSNRPKLILSLALDAQCRKTSVNPCCFWQDLQVWDSFGINAITSTERFIRARKSWLMLALITNMVYMQTGYITQSIKDLTCLIVILTPTG